MRSGSYLHAPQKDATMWNVGNAADGSSIAFVAAVVVFLLLLGARINRRVICEDIAVSSHSFSERECGVHQASRPRPILRASVQAVKEPYTGCRQGERVET